MSEARAPQARQQEPVSMTRGSLWLPFLQRLTMASPRAVVWKNASAALEGRGDLDVIAPPGDWMAIEGEFRRWAEARGLGPIAVCRHVPGSIFLIAADPERPAFFELDVKARGSYRGTTIFRADDLIQLSEMDVRGFRRLRAGAEGLLKLILNGTADDGTLNERRVQRERILELLRGDPDGMNAAALLFGGAERMVRELAIGFLAGDWSRSRMLMLRARLRLRLLREPAVLMERLRPDVVRAGACHGIKALLKEGRLSAGDRVGLERVVRDHSSVSEAARA